MNQAVRWLRISYWWGIIADAVMAVLMLFPQQFSEMMKIDVESARSFNYGVRYGAPLMIGWTILLLWADRRPLERKDILLITLFPVVAGFVIFEIYSVAAGYGTMETLIPLLVMQSVMSAVFVFSYIKAKRADNRDRV
jgi:hypothetical protein